MDLWDPWRLSRAHPPSTCRCGYSWNSDVSLSDIIVTGATSSSSAALYIYTPTNVTLTRVNVHNNAGSGAMIINHYGTGAVTVSSSTFSANAAGDGLDIYSKGTITLNFVTARAMA